MLKIIVTVVLGILGFAIERLIAWINRRVKESKFSENITKAKGIVKSVVEKLYQTVVEREKKTGNFTIERQRQVLQVAMQQSYKYMNKSLQNFLKKQYNDVNIWLQTQIESTIYTLKHKEITV